MQVRPQSLDQGGKLPMVLIKFKEGQGTISGLILLRFAQMVILELMSQQRHDVNKYFIILRCHRNISIIIDNS